MDEPTPPPALKPQEWQSRFFQHDELVGMISDDALALIRTGPQGDVETVRIRGEQCRAVAALALAALPDGFRWEDHKDLSTMAVLLWAYASGVPFAELESPLRDEFHALMHRRNHLAARLAALLPPRE